MPASNLSKGGQEHTAYASFSAADKSLIMGYLTIPHAKILYSTFTYIHENPLNYPVL